ncbi:MAG: hypothetical protein J0L92_39990 [Deltaproteobacteria bacterium]|nr:hypothetical protein [Deltaproteobacteria bacterium]
MVRARTVGTAALSAASAMGCGGRPCPAVEAPTEAGDVPIGVAGDEPLTIAADVDAGWVVYAQARSDTNATGRVGDGDRRDVWLDLNGVEQRIDALLGSTAHTLIVLRSDSMIRIDLRDGRETALGHIGEATIPAGRIGSVGEASLGGHGRLVTLRSRFEVEVLDTETGERRTHGSSAWIHTAWQDISETWLVIETLDTEPIDPAQTTQRPHVSTSHRDDWCAGLRPCSGPSRTHTLRPLDGAGPPVTLQLTRAELRPWGWVAELVDGASAMGLLSGPVRSFPDGCVPLFAGFETPFVVSRCGTDLFAIEPEGPPLPLSEALTRISALDASLLSLDTVRESLSFQDRALQVQATSMDPITVRFGSQTFRWTRSAGRWFLVESQPCPSGVRAVGRHRTLMLREGTTAICGIEQRRGASQLVWTERIVDGQCGERLAPPDALGDQ